MAYGVAMSRRGYYRPRNEDSCCFFEAQTSVGSLCMAIVCDGVGGLEHGELASSTVVERFAAWFEHELRHLLATCNPHYVLETIQDAWARELRRANEDLIAYGRAHNTRLATTFTGVMVHDGSYLVCHVGDSRLYKVRDGTSLQLTHDHTFVARELAQGRLSAEQARNHPKAHVIYQAVGASEWLEPELLRGTCGKGDVLLLMSDGAYRHSSETLLGELFGHARWMDTCVLAQSCKRLLTHDLDVGETDNLSIVAVSFADLCDVGTMAFARRRSA